jgi:hypothetical protein
VYIVSIGRAIPSQWIKAICLVNNVTCHQLDHYNVANEEKILEIKHQFCIERPKQTAIYVHSKGSFHPSTLAPEFKGHGVKPPLQLLRVSYV